MVRGGTTEDSVLVVDNGAGWIKAERASADRPRCFPNAAIKSRAEAFTRYGCRQGEMDAPLRVSLRPLTIEHAQAAPLELLLSVACQIREGRVHVEYVLLPWLLG